MWNKHAIMIMIIIAPLNFFGQTNEPVQNNNQNENSIDEDLLDSLKSVLNDFSSECLKIEMSYDGYESSNEEIVYFDSLAVIKAFQCSWNMEGLSGENFSWFSNDELSAYYEENQGHQDGPEIIFIGRYCNKDKLKAQNMIVNQRIKAIEDAIIANQDIVAKDDSGFTITIEESKNYGFDFTETTKIFIDKILYNQLFKD